jgi:transglutaminase-like putative cysteine protease
VKPHGRLVVAAEVGLVGLTLAALSGMGRLLDGAWAIPLVASAIAAHLVAAVLRRVGLRLVPSATIMVLLALAAVIWTGYGDTVRYLLPTAETWRALDADLELAWEVFRDIRAPAPAEPGFLVVSSLALWFIAFIADWAAFRLWVPFEGTLPAGTLFVFASLLGSPAGRTSAIALFAGAFLGFMLLHRVAREDSTSNWVADGPVAGQRRLLAAGGSLAVIAVLAGLVLGPLLPGAGAEAMVDYRGRLDGPDSRVTISPLVDIRARLVQQRDIEVFTVRANDRSYWRLTSLEEFDGRIWRSSGSFGRADGNLPRAIEQADSVAPIEQVFSIEALAMLWLPAAYEPRTLDAGDAEIRYDEDSSTFIVDRSMEASDGLTYRVSSEAPRFDPATLAAAAAQGIPDSVRDRYLGLPDDFPGRVVDLALRLTADATSPYEQALLLQDHLRRFDYDLDVAPGHDEAALERFLFDDQRGYCEQFAGSFAAMARSIGLPARVAVGFTPGEIDLDDPSIFHVRGEHAHAWPEVYLAGAGWVAFEPTPGRGIPGGETYTRVPEQQANEPPGSRPTDDPSAPTTEAPGPTASLPDQDDLQTSPAPIPDLESPGGGSGSTDGGGGLPGALRPVARVAPFVGGALVGYLVLVPLSLLGWRFLRRRRATTADRRVRLAWIESQEGAALLGVVPSPSETIAEKARRLASRLPRATDDAEALARWMEAVEYGPTGASDDTADAAADAAARIEAAALTNVGRRIRLRRWLDPRPLFRGATAGHVRRFRRISPSPT